MGAVAGGMAASDATLFDYCFENLNPVTSGVLSQSARSQFTNVALSSSPPLDGACHGFRQRLERTYSSRLNSRI
jgi:hypothetical protein